MALSLRSNAVRFLLFGNSNGIHRPRSQPEIEAIQREGLPASALGKAARYTLALWPKLVRFLEYPEIELSNNLAENSMRPVVLGRKNWIHLGSQEAGPKVAAILSVVETGGRRLSNSRCQRQTNGKERANSRASSRRQNSHT